MKQQRRGLGQSSKRTRRSEFLGEMERVVPWSDLVAPVTPHRPHCRRGRLPLPVAAMLRIHFMSQWFNLHNCVSACWHFKALCIEKSKPMQSG